MLFRWMRTAAAAVLFLFALGVAVEAWRGREKADLILLYTPARRVRVVVSPRLFIWTWHVATGDGFSISIDPVWSRGPYALYFDPHHTLSENWAALAQRAGSFSVTSWNWHDFGWAHGISGPYGDPSHRMAHLPTWSVLAATAIPLPALLLLRLRRRSRRRPGLCPACRLRPASLPNPLPRVRPAHRLTANLTWRRPP